MVRALAPTPFSSPTQLDPAAQALVRRLLREASLAPDGRLDPETLAALRDAVERRSPSSSSRPLSRSSSTSQAPGGPVVRADSLLRADQARIAGRGEGAHAVVQRTARPERPATPAAAAPKKPPYDPSGDSKALYDAMHGGMFGSGTDEAAIYKALEGKTPEQIDAIRKSYKDHYKRDLDADLKDELSGAELSRAENLMKGDRAAADADALHEAISGAGTNEEEIFKVLEGKDKAQLDAIKKSYDARHGDLDKDLKGDLSAAELDRAQALLRGDKAAADAATLNHAMKGGLFGGGTDEDAVYKSLEGKKPEERQAILEAYGRMYGKGPGDRSTLDTHLKEEFSAAELDRAEALRDGDQVGADAAKVRHAMKGGLFGAGTDTQAIQETFEGRDDAHRKAVTLAYDRRYGQRDSSGQVTHGLRQDLRDEMSDLELGKTTALIERGELSDVEKIYYGTQGAGTDEAAIREALRGKSKDEIRELRRQYAETFRGHDLDADLRGDLSGREWFDASQDLKGKPENAKEALDRMNERHAFERRGLLNSQSRGFMDAISDKGDLLDGNVARANDFYNKTMREKGRLDPADEAELDKLIRYADQDVDTYRTAKDSAADTAATVASTAAAVAVTIGTAGAGAPLVAVALCAGGAGAATRVATKWAIQGQGYGLEAGLTDGAIGAVDGASSVVGMGAGKLAAGTVLRASAKGTLEAAGAKQITRRTVELCGREMLETSAMRRVAYSTAQGAVDGITGGAASGATQEALRDGTWERGLASGLERVAAGAGTGAALGGVAGGVMGGAMTKLGGKDLGLIDESQIWKTESMVKNHWATYGTYDDMLSVNRALRKPATIDVLDPTGHVHPVKVYGAGSQLEIDNISASLERMRKLGAWEAMPSEIHVRDTVGVFRDANGNFRSDPIGGLGGTVERTMVIGRPELRTPGSAAYVIHHEAGHNVDVALGRMRGVRTLSEGPGGHLFGHGQSVNPGYGLLNPMEDFAETHRVLIEKWDQILQNPARYIDNNGDIGRKFQYILDEAYGIQIGRPPPPVVPPPLPPPVPPPIPRTAPGRIATPGDEGLSRIARAGIVRAELSDAGEAFARSELHAINSARSRVTGGLDQITVDPRFSAESQIAARKARNALEQHGNPEDFTGALRDLRSRPVRLSGSGETWDHIQEVTSTLNSLNNARKALLKDLERFPVGSSEHQQLAQQLTEMRELWQRGQRFLRIE